MFVELLMKLQQNTKSHEYLCMLNYCPTGNYERTYQEYLEKTFLEQ